MVHVDRRIGGGDVTADIASNPQEHALDNSIRPLRIKEGSQMLDIEAIRGILPHRYPFLLVDRILELEPGKRAVGLKNVTINEEFFQGHFPGHAVMPGVLVLEAMAQVGGVMLLSMPGFDGMLAYFGRMENVRFRKRILPGDTLITEAVLLKIKGRAGKVRVEGRVDDQVAVEAEFMFALVDREPSDSESTQSE